MTRSVTSTSRTKCRRQRKKENSKKTLSAGHGTQLPRRIGRIRRICLEFGVGMCIWFSCVIFPPLLNKDSNQHCEIEHNKKCKKMSMDNDRQFDFLATWATTCDNMNLDYPMVISNSSACTPRTRKRPFERNTCEIFVTDRFAASFQSCKINDPSQHVNVPPSIEISTELQEPVRSMIHSAAPKRFYRTFWRSAARRLVELENIKKTSMQN